MENEKKGYVKMNETIKYALEFDPILNAEKAFGDKHWSKFSDEEMKSAMGLAFLHNKRKDNLLKQNHDTHFSMTWNEFEDILISNGFKNGYEEVFPYEDHKEKAVIFYREDGLLIWATSFDHMKSVNGGTMYGEIILNDKDNRKKMPPCSNGFYDVENNKLYFDTDIREGLIYFINQMSQLGTFIPKWEKDNKFFWFLNYSSDEKENSDNYRNISKNKMNMFCDEAKKIIEKYLD